MTSLRVSPEELRAVAAAVSTETDATAAAVPAGWLVAAGSDPGSREVKLRCDQQLAALRTSLGQVLTGIRHTVADIDSAASEYETADAAVAGALDGRGGATGPAGSAAVQQITFPVSPSAVPAGSGTIEPITFARQLRSGPGAEATRQLATDIRAFLSGPYLAGIEGLGRASSRLTEWTPVGASAAADLTRHGGLLAEIGTELGDLASEVDRYSTAFTVAQGKHPSEEELLAARQQLVAALRSGDDLAIQAALAKYQELRARSAETIGEYFGGLGALPPAEDGSGSGSGDSSALTSMLPLLLSSLGGLGETALGNEDLGYDDFEEYPLEDYPLEYDPLSYSPGGFAGAPSGFGGGGGGVPEVAVGAMPVAAGAAGLGGTPAVRAPTVEPFTGAGGGATTAASRTGSPYMPYMPMAPGANPGGGGNDRNRVVAWHPDRLMYVDDTPHTDPVIGEKPAIAPAVTPPTPALPTSNPSGVP